MSTKLLNFTEYWAKSAQKMLKSRRFNENVVTLGTVTQTLRSKARPASLQTGEMQNAPRRSSDTERAETTKSKPLTASGGGNI